MGIFLSYLFLGLSLAAPIGPINAAQLDRGIKEGFLNAWMVGIGAMIADMLYMAAVYMGVVQFLEIPIVKTFLWLFGFFVLVYTGIECIAGAGKIVTQSRKSKGESIHKSFFSGFIMSLSNPLTILFWLGIYGSVLAKTAHTYDASQLMLYSFAIFTGITIWDLFMALLASSFRKLLTAKILVGISMVSGLSLVGFGFYFGYEAVKLLFF
ncbi:LysE family transporter [Niallia endozanthoxylica]|uniref:Amino acid transporter n=1 Tax=Niallia endozanthoxylica TaxID=2036016 RepID=A0A5J5HQK8_9BACI|nr:LysE family transporter [Niallia endozanthoxylica]KAA9021799.1 amino acid transporter [Niallia endozanthoxylica]